MDTITIDKKEYVILAKKEYQQLLASASPRTEVRSKRRKPARPETHREELVDQITEGLKQTAKIMEGKIKPKTLGQILHGK